MYILDTPSWGGWGVRVTFHVHTSSWGVGGRESKKSDPITVTSCTFSFHHVRR